MEFYNNILFILKKNLRTCRYRCPFERIEKLETGKRRWNGKYCTAFTLKISVADPDPGSGAFLTLDLDPGSGIGFFPDPRSQPHIF
jgi:hypothetical protein